MYCNYTNTSQSFQIVIVNGQERVLMPGMGIDFPAGVRVEVRDGHITSPTADHITYPA